MWKSDLSAHLLVSFSVSGITTYSVSFCCHLLSMSNNFSLFHFTVSPVLVSFLLSLHVFLCLIPILWDHRSIISICENARNLERCK